MGIADILLHSSWFLFWVSVSEIYSKWVETPCEIGKHIIISKKTSKFDLPVHWELKQSEYLKNPPSRCSQSKFPVYFLFERQNFICDIIASALILMLIWFRQKNMQVFHMFCKESNTYLKKNDLGSDQEYIWLEQLIAQPFLHTCIYPNDRTPSVIVAE